MYASESLHFGIVSTDLVCAIKKTLRASEQDRADVALARAQWRKRQKQWKPEHLVFIDETGLNTKMVRLYGRAHKSQRCFDKAPYGHWHTNTFIAALRIQGLCAPWLLDGPMDTESFRVYIDRLLIPQLRHGDLVICDNLCCHRAAGIAEHGARILYLPPYSPDLNPIEMLFAKLKTLMRQQAQRSLDGLSAALAESLNQISSGECQNYIRHPQYATN